jgi:hypothetical protein
VAKAAHRVVVAVVVAVAAVVASPPTQMPLRLAQIQPRAMKAMKTARTIPRIRPVAHRVVVDVVAVGDQKARRVPPMTRPAPSSRSANRVTLSVGLRAPRVSKPSVSVVAKDVTMAVAVHQS